MLFMFNPYDLSSAFQNGINKQPQQILRKFPYKKQKSNKKPACFFHIKNVIPESLLKPDNIRTSIDFHV